MTVSIWVPVLVAAIAGVAAYIAARTPRRTSPEEKKQRESEVAITGLVALLAALEEERAYLREALRECRETLNTETRQRRVKT